VPRPCRSRAFSSTGRRLAAVLAAAGLAVSAAGCGGAGGPLSKSEYEAKLKSLATSVSSDVAEFAAFDSTRLASAPSFLNGVAGTLERFERQLGAVVPPRDAAVLHRRLIADASSAATEIRTLAQRVGAASPAEARRLLAEFTPGRLGGLRRLEETADALAAKGYEFSSTAGR